MKRKIATVLLALLAVFLAVPIALGAGADGGAVAPVVAPAAKASSTSILDYVIANWQGILTILGVIVGTSSAITGLAPPPKGGSVVAWIQWGIGIFSALKPKGEKGISVPGLPASRAPRKGGAKGPPPEPPTSGPPAMPPGPPATV